MLAKVNFPSISLHYTELAAKLLRNFRGSSNLRLTSRKREPKWTLFFLAEEGRFELPLQVSPN